MKMPVPFSEALSVLKKIEANGFEAYFVGGCVRDYMIEREINDVDIASSATPEEIKNIFTHTVDVGIEHGTVMVLSGGKSYEITTFRSESSYSDFRRPDKVKFVRELAEDLKRRDFTMNAMAMAADYSLIDLFDGQKDLQKKVIRTVGRPQERFQEDALRMLRGARFASQLSFAIEDNTFHAMTNYAHLLEHVAVERKRMEMDKLLLGVDYEKGLRYLSSSGLVSYIPCFPLTLHVLDRLKNVNLKGFSIEQCWAAMILMMNIPDAVEFLKEWRHSNKKIQSVSKLIRFYKRRTVGNWTPAMLYQAGIELAYQTEALYAAIHQKEMKRAVIDQLWAHLPIKERNELSINGKKIMDLCNKPGGPWVGELLNEIEKNVIAEKLLNEEDEIKKWVETWLQK